ncbi:hypothetical protein LOAG_14210 [Loa loa]|uniref:Uncharacterized protein n=1 Tax=Loa loa TaxID=7209 RepID=A0A1S0TI68_LOALO|nr:hypothetical protein LOAG_14210 [Loa loa]EFO14313.1 hypothetical protein LOAG_14210 [Loa loa]
MLPFVITKYLIVLTMIPLNNNANAIQRFIIELNGQRENQSTQAPQTTNILLQLFELHLRGFPQRLLPSVGSSPHYYYHPSYSRYRTYDGYWLCSYYYCCYR